MNEITNEVKVGQVWQDMKSANTRYLRIIELIKDNAGVVIAVLYRAFAKDRWKFEDGDATKKRKFPQKTQSSIKNLRHNYRLLNDVEVAELEKPVAFTAVSSVVSESNSNVAVQTEDVEEKTSTQIEKKDENEQFSKAILAQISDHLMMYKQTVHVLQILLQKDNEALRKEVEALREEIGELRRTSVFS